MDIRNGMQDNLHTFMTFKETLFQCNSCLLSFFYFVPHCIPFFALVRIATLSCKSNNDMNVYAYGLQ